MKPYLAVKALLKTEIKIGIPDLDFVRDLHTVMCKIRFRHLAYISLMKISDEAEDEPFIKKFKEINEDRVARQIWRLNDKRTRHGLESWI